MRCESVAANVLDRHEWEPLATLSSFIRFRYHPPFSSRLSINPSDIDQLTSITHDNSHHLFLSLSSFEHAFPFPLRSSSRGEKWEEGNKRHWFRVMKRNQLRGESPLSFSLHVFVSKEKNRCPLRFPSIVKLLLHPPLCLRGGLKIVRR